jgi:hypothetical protein
VRYIYTFSATQSKNITHLNACLSHALEFLNPSSTAIGDKLTSVIKASKNTPRYHDYLDLVPLFNSITPSRVLPTRQTNLKSSSTLPAFIGGPDNWDPTTLRDSALLLLLLDSGRRASELEAIYRDNTRFSSAGFHFKIYFGKQNKNHFSLSAEQLIPWDFAHPQLCTATRIQTYLARTPRVQSIQVALSLTEYAWHLPLFCKTPTRHQSTPLVGLKASSIDTLVKKRLLSVYPYINWNGKGAHILRGASSSEMLHQGCPLTAILTFVDPSETTFNAFYKRVPNSPQKPPSQALSTHPVTFLRQILDHH